MPSTTGVGKVLGSISSHLRVMFRAKGKERKDRRGKGEEMSGRGGRKEGMVWEEREEEGSGREMER